MEYRPQTIGLDLEDDGHDGCQDHPVFVHVTHQEVGDSTASAVLISDELDVGNNDADVFIVCADGEMKPVSNMLLPVLRYLDAEFAKIPSQIRCKLVDRWKIALKDYIETNGSSGAAEKILEQAKRFSTEVGRFDRLRKVLEQYKLPIAIEVKIWAADNTVNYAKLSGDLKGIVEAYNDLAQQVAIPTRELHQRYSAELEAAQTALDKMRYVGLEKLLIQCSNALLKPPFDLSQEPGSLVAQLTVEAVEQAIPEDVELQKKHMQAIADFNQVGSLSAKIQKLHELDTLLIEAEAHAAEARYAQNPYSGPLDFLLQLEGLKGDESLIALKEDISNGVAKSVAQRIKMSARAILTAINCKIDSNDLNLNWAQKRNLRQVWHAATRENANVRQLQKAVADLKDCAVEAAQEDLIHPIITRMNQLQNSIYQEFKIDVDMTGKVAWRSRVKHEWLIRRNDDYRRQYQGLRSLSQEYRDWLAKKGGQEKSAVRVTSANKPKRGWMSRFARA